MRTLWEHTDTPTAALLNEYSAALNDAHDRLGEVGGWSEAQERVSESVYTLLHTHQYLHFVSNGQISELDGSNETDINEDESGQGVIDLDTLPWLVYGQLYTVTGVSVCIEDWTP